MKVKRIHADAGFTLLEAMIATMIIGIVLASVLAVASHGARYLAEMRRTARSTQILQQRVEDIRLMSWSQLQSVPGTFFDPNDPAQMYAGYITQAAFDTYNGTTTVSKVTFTVVWTNATGRVLTNRLTTLISNGGLNKYIL
jgi:prepilin-type N-terminal cleavage/methylation domain-containing protein